MVSDDENSDAGKFLPDLPDEISGEQLVWNRKCSGLMRFSLRSTTIY